MTDCRWIVDRTAVHVQYTSGRSDKGGIKKIGERAGLLRKMSEKNPSETYFDEHLKGQVEDRTRERRDFWMGGVSSWCLEVVKRKSRRGAEGIWTYCPLEDRAVDPPYWKMFLFCESEQRKMEVEVIFVSY